MSPATAPAALPQPAVVPDGTRVYAIGDIHGCMELLRRLLDEIGRDLAQGRTRRTVIVFLGDYVDRGPESREVVDLLAAGVPPEGPLAGTEWVTLRGNHEDFMMEFLADFSVGRAWMANGGLETIRSYLGAIPEGVTDCPAVQRRLYRSLPPAHLRFLSKLPASHSEGGYMFVHAGVRPGVPLDRQDSYDLMWIRDAFLWSDDDFGKVVVHGHSVVAVPDLRPNRIAIDTGAYRTGHLTCLVLEGSDRRFLST
jgi:serine/threonine protein phosphatase 1